jgi:hypothetical protein
MKYDCCNNHAAIYESCINKTENIHLGNAMLFGERAVENGGGGVSPRMSGIVVYSLTD